MTDELAPRRRKKQAQIIRVDVYTQYEAERYPVIGEAWAAVTPDGLLITCGPDIAAVTQAARFAGFWIASQFEDDAA